MNYLIFNFNRKRSVQILTIFVIIFSFIHNIDAQARNCLDERYRCLNGGLCITRAGAGNVRVCSCRSPWCGRTCSKQIPNCIEEDFDCRQPGQQCQNSGVCVSQPLLGGFLCSCRTGFCGNTCSNRQPNCMLFAK